MYMRVNALLNKYGKKNTRFLLYKKPSNTALVLKFLNFPENDFPRG